MLKILIEIAEALYPKCVAIYFKLIADQICYLLVEIATPAI
jgi:hypothetical protein